MVQGGQAEEVSSSGHRPSLFTTDSVTVATGDSFSRLSLHRPASWHDGFSESQLRAATVSMTSHSTRSRGVERRARLEEWTCGLGVTKAEEVRPPVDKPPRRHRPFTTILEEHAPDANLARITPLLARTRANDEVASSGYILMDSSDDIPVVHGARRNVYAPQEGSFTTSDQTPSSASSGYLLPVTHRTMTSEKTNGLYRSPRSSDAVTARTQTRYERAGHNTRSDSRSVSPQYDRKSSSGVRLPVRVFPEKPHGPGRRKVVAVAVSVGGLILVLAAVVVVLVMTREYRLQTTALVVEGSDWWIHHVTC